MQILIIMQVIATESDGQNATAVQSWPSSEYSKMEQALVKLREANRDAVYYIATCSLNS